MRRLGRRLLLTAAGLGVVLAAAEVAAQLDVRKRRSQRSALGDQLYRRTLGQGPPVVFLAGLQGSTRFWGESFDPLARSGRRLIFVDALGFGRSPWPAVDYTLQDHLLALQRTLAAERATAQLTLVGHSLGALLSAEYAAAFPGQVRRLVLLGAPVFEGEADARARLREMSAMAAAFSLHPVLARESCQLVCALRPVLVPILPTLLPRLREPVAQDAVLHHWGSFHGTMEHVLLRRRLTTALRRLPASVEVVIVHGREDRVTPLARVEELSRAGLASLVLLDGGHGDYLRSAELLVQLVADG